MRAPFGETRIRVTKKKTAHIQAAHGELYIAATSGRGPYHRALQAGWSVLLRTCPDAVCILAGHSALENGPKVWERNLSKVRVRPEAQRNFFGPNATPDAHPKDGGCLA